MNVSWIDFLTSNVFKGALSGVRQFLATGSPLKLVKMLFISPQKFFLFSRCSNFRFDFFIMQKNSLIRKITLILSFMASHPGSQIIKIHILPNIVRNKGKQTMKFGQLTEYNRNIFLQKSCTEFVGTTSPRLFSDKLNLIISLDQ